MAETSTIFGFMKYVSATDILSDFKKTVDSYFVNSLRCIRNGYIFFLKYKKRCMASSPFKLYYCIKNEKENTMHILNLIMDILIGVAFIIKVCFK